MRWILLVSMSETYTAPSGPVATSLRNFAPSTLMRDLMVPLETSIETISSTSATHNVPPWLRRPLGEFSPVTQLTASILPSRVSLEMTPLPSLSIGVPPGRRPICETNSMPLSRSR